MSARAHTHRARAESPGSTSKRLVRLTAVAALKAALLHQGLVALLIFLVGLGLRSWLPLPLQEAAGRGSCVG